MESAMGEESSKHFDSNFGNILAKVADLLIPASQKWEVRSSQNSV
jgi:hypothetical protein